MFRSSLGKSKIAYKMGNPPFEKGGLGGTTEGKRAKSNSERGCQMSQIDMSNIDRIIDVHESRREHLIHILQDISIECNYLPEDGLRRVATRLDVPLSRIYSMATFYRDFSLKPRGRHLIKVCVGSACHVKGGGRILEKLERDLRLTPGGTTEDMEFSLETVRCLGACALGPMLVIDGDYYGQMTSGKIDSVIKRYRASTET